MLGKFRTESVDRVKRYNGGWDGSNKVVKLSITSKLKLRRMSYLYRYFVYSRNR